MEAVKTEERKMRIYIAKCTTADPEVENGPYYIHTLGAFSTKELAEQSFTKEVKVPNKTEGYWVKKHICFEGAHEIEEYEIDKWIALY